MEPCRYAQAARDHGVTVDEWAAVPSRRLRDLLGVASKSTVNTLRNAHRDMACSCYGAGEPSRPAPVSSEVSGTMDLGADGGEFQNIRTDAPLTDWSGVFAQFNLDPAVFEIVDDTVRYSAWQQSKRLENGDRDTVTLYSYRARFRRKSTEDRDRLADLIAHVRDWTPTARPSHGDSAPVTAVIALADWQLGKGEGDGTLGTIRRIQDGLAATRDYLDARQAEGYHIERVLLANMGDHIEAVQGSYASQPATVDLNLRDQLTLALELNMQWVKAMREYAPVTYAAALCNHGQWARSGHDSVMGDADNATGFIGDQLATVCKFHDALADVEFVIPRDEMITRTTVSGVNIPLSHGHKISGNEGTWLATQSAALTHQHRYIPDLWLTAHKHHAQVTDFGPYTRIQATTADPGSKWLYDQKGVYSTPGTTVFLAGAHLPMKWAKYEVLA